jgi:hypothetical protein
LAAQSLTPPQLLHSYHRVFSHQCPTQNSVQLLNPRLTALL